MFSKANRSYCFNFIMVAILIFGLLEIVTFICIALVGAQEEPLPILKANELKKKDIVDRMELLQYQLIAAQNAMAVWREKVNITQMEINSIKMEMKQLIDERKDSKKEKDKK